MTALDRPRMAWLECGHERITLTRVYEGRRLPCFNPECMKANKGRSPMRTITAVGTIDGYDLYALPSERPSLLRRVIEALR